MTKQREITPEEIERKWIEHVEKHLVRRKIVKAFFFPEQEAEENEWDSRPIILELDDGSYIFPLRDEEGNDGGALATGYNGLPTIPPRW